MKTVQNIEFEATFDVEKLMRAATLAVRLHARNAGFSVAEILSQLDLSNPPVTKKESIIAGWLVELINLAKALAATAKDAVHA